MHEAPKARRVRGRGGVIRCGAPRCSVVRFVPRALGHGDHPVGRQHARSSTVAKRTLFDFLPSLSTTYGYLFASIDYFSLYSRTIFSIVPIFLERERIGCRHSRSMGRPPTRVEAMMNCSK